MTDISIRHLNRADHRRAVDFAIEGMHLGWYVNNPWLLRLYGRYFWNLELAAATEIYAAYADGRFIGVLLARMEGQRRAYRSWAWDAILGIAKLVRKPDAYDRANAEMLRDYPHPVDGEICFLAADPHSGVKGVGTRLLEAFAQGKEGKRVFLYTDSGCTWQFYEARGFTRAGKRTIPISRGGTLDCFLYTRQL